jgi:hypothetical protein
MSEDTSADPGPWLKTQTARARTSLRRRRINLAGLEGEVRVAAWVGLVAALGCTLVVALVVRRVSPLGDEHLARWGTIERLAIVAGYLGLAVGAGVLVAGTFLEGWRARRLTRLLVGLTGTFVAGSVIVQSRLVSDVNAQFDPSSPVAYPHAHADLAHAIGWFGFAVAIAAALAPVRLLRSRRPLLPVAAGVPFVAAAIAYALAGSTPNLLLDQPRSLQSAIADGFVSSIALLAVPVTLLLLWQAVEGIRASRDLGYLAARASKRRPPVLPIALTAKTAFVVLGLAGILPHVLGGGSSVWRHSRHDGVVSWALAAAAGAGVLVWLLRRTPGEASTRGLMRGALGVAVLAFLFLLLETVVIAVSGSLQPFDSRITLHVKHVANWLNDESITEMFSSVFVIGAVGALLVWRRRTSLGVFLLIFCFWAAPRAIHQLAGSHDGTGIANFVTLDAAVTVALVVAYVLKGRGGSPETRQVLLIALVVSTLVAYAGFVSSVLPRSNSNKWFWIVLAFPLVYQLLFDSREINEGGERRPVLLLSLVGIATMLLAVELVQVADGELNSHTVTGGNVGQVMFGVPLAALLVAAALREEGEDAAGSPAG